MEPVEIIARALEGIPGCEGAGDFEGCQKLIPVNECSCRELARAALKAIEDAGLCVVPVETVWTLRSYQNAHAWNASDEEFFRELKAQSATPTPSRTEEGDGW